MAPISLRKQRQIWLKCGVSKTNLTPKIMSNVGDPVVLSISYVDAPNASNELNQRNEPTNLTS